MIPLVCVTNPPRDVLGAGVDRVGAGPCPHAATGASTRRANQEVSLETWHIIGPACKRLEGRSAVVRAAALELRGIAGNAALPLDDCESIASRGRTRKPSVMTDQEEP